MLDASQAVTVAYRQRDGAEYLCESCARAQARAEIIDPILTSVGGIMPYPTAAAELGAGMIADEALSASQSGTHELPGFQPISRYELGKTLSERAYEDGLPEGEFPAEPCGRCGTTLSPS